MSKSWQWENHYIVNTRRFLSVSLSLLAGIECHKATNCDDDDDDLHHETGNIKASVRLWFYLIESKQIKDFNDDDGDDGDGDDDDDGDDSLYDCS